MNLRKWRREHIMYSDSSFRLDSTQDGQMLDLLKKRNWKLMHVDDWYVRTV